MNYDLWVDSRFIGFLIEYTPDYENLDRVHSRFMRIWIEYTPDLWDFW